MNKAIKLGRCSNLSFFSQPSISSPSSSFNSIATYNKNSNVRFVQVSSRNTSSSTSDKSDNMENQKTPSNTKKPINVMEDSFGEGYSTRCDEEGFGGIYGRNDECDVDSKLIKDPGDHDSTQGSQVKEKEKARNQTQAQ